jgi:hypothetical protein
MMWKQQYPNLPGGDWVCARCGWPDELDGRRLEPDDEESDESS